MLHVLVSAACALRPGSLPLGIGASVAVARHAQPSLSASVTELPFAKYHGLGNDFLLVDSRSSKEPPITPEQAVKMCDRNFGVGADGVIFVLPANDDAADCQMRIYNSDGSEPEMCGNGIRCMARFISTLAPNEAKASSDGVYTISTLAGLIKPKLLQDGEIRVDMGQPILQGSRVPTTLPADVDGRVIKAPLSVGGSDFAVTCVSMGNPHAIIFVDDLDAIDLATIGPQIECHEVFPAKTNVEFVQVLSPTHLKMKVWERGAGPTLACGTGACALLVAAVLEGRAERSATVTLPGGDLQIEWREEDDTIFMTGPAVPVFSGVYSVE